MRPKETIQPVYFYVSLRKSRQSQRNKIGQGVWILINWGKQQYWFFLVVLCVLFVFEEKDVPYLQVLEEHLTHKGFMTFFKVEELDKVKVTFIFLLFKFLRKFKDPMCQDAIFLDSMPWTPLPMSTYNFYFLCHY